MNCQSLAVPALNELPSLMRAAVTLLEQGGRILAPEPATR